MLIELVLFIVLISFLWKLIVKPSDYPPGYWGVPFIGYIPLTKKNIYEYVLDIHKKYEDSKVISWRVGEKLLVFMLDHDLRKEAFKSEAGSGRPNLTCITFSGGNVGYAFSGASGLRWQNNRRFTLSLLRNLGMGKSRMLSAIHFEAKELVKVFEKWALEKRNIFPDIPMSIAVTNIIWQLVGSMRFDYEDETAKWFILSTRSIFEVAVGLTIVDLIPWLSYVLPSFILNKYLHQDLRKEIADKSPKYLQGFIDAHKMSEDDGEVKDFISEYLIKLKEEENNPESTFSATDMLYTISDLIGAGTETTANSVQFIVLYLAKYPDVQKKLQEEIDRALPKGTLPTMEDKIRLPYTESVIHETLRHTSFIQFGAPHEATEDMNLGGYKIPKGSMLIEAQFYINKDKQLWDSPEEYRPERFLDSEGKFVMPKFFAPFGIGKRVCIGEALARMELFVYVVALVQAIHFSAPPGKTIDTELIMNKIISSPNQKQEVIMTLR